VLAQKDRTPVTAIPSGDSGALKSSTAHLLI